MNQSLRGCSSTQLCTPLLHPGRGTANGASAAFVTTTAIEGTYMAALGVDCLESVGLAEPARAETHGLMKSSAENSEAVNPPTVTANTLTH